MGECHRNDTHPKFSNASTCDLPISSFLYFYPADGSSGGVTAVVEVKNVSGLLGRSARLPCDTTPPSPDHPLLLVIWFKEPSPDPVYRYIVFKDLLFVGTLVDVFCVTCIEVSKKVLRDLLGRIMLPLIPFLVGMILIHSEKMNNTYL